MKPKKVRLQDIARAARVSPATVSRVINRTGRVSPEILERVQASAEQLAFDLRERRKPRLLAFVLGNRSLLHPFHSRILGGAEACCAQQGYHVVFLSVSYRSDVPPHDLQVPHILQRRDFVDGYILAGAHSQNLLDLLGATGQPVALLGNNVVQPWRAGQYDTVYYDDIEGTYRATRYLHSLGHRDIWFVGNQRLPWFDRCHDGYLRAMNEAGLVSLSMSPDAEQPREAGYLGTKSLLSQGSAFTAIVAGSDATAQGVCEALRDSGLSVPADVSVVGVDDIEAPTMHPRLTTVHIFLEQIGRQLADFVITRVSQPEAPARTAVVPTRLVKGESCREPAAQAYDSPLSRSPVRHAAQS